MHVAIMATYLVIQYAQRYHLHVKACAIIIISVSIWIDFLIYPATTEHLYWSCICKYYTDIPLLPLAVGPSTTIILWITFELCPFLDSVRYTNCLSILLHQHNHFSRSGLSSVLCWIPMAVVVDWNNLFPISAPDWTVVYKTSSSSDDVGATDSRQ